MVIAGLGLSSAVCPLSSAFSQDDPLKMIEAKRAELKQREDEVKREEERLDVLRKDVDAKVADYTKLLAQIEALLKQFDATRNQQLENVIKAYEAMPAEDAAVRIAALDNATALMILRGMKSKKAGAAMAAMDPEKAAVLTRGLTAVKGTRGK